MRRAASPTDCRDQNAAVFQATETRSETGLGRREGKRASRRLRQCDGVGLAHGTARAPCHGRDTLRGKGHAFQARRCRRGSYADVAQG